MAAPDHSPQAATYCQSHPLLPAALIARIEPQVCPHPLKPSAIRYMVRLDNITGLKHTGVHLCRIPPLTESLIFHWHRTDEEWTYIISGTGELDLSYQHEDGAIDHDRIVTEKVGPGDFMGHTRNGRAHALRNTSETDELVYLCGGERTEKVICEYPTVRKTLYYRAGGNHRYEDMPSDEREAKETTIAG
ncbi:hypothetical protein DFJ77DRAFT_183867 [Powellomyces hirtus]|nr:hypothetical protein DFJ77DRAFT_183867 [Powellomyces hirtus]